jgi:uncharacterized membrane protein SpoIIM required for sporulation
MPTAASSPFDFRQRYDIETPEQVVVGYELAGIGSRALAAVVDHLILLAIGGVLLLLVGLFGLLDVGLGGGSLFVIGVAYLVVLCFYFVLFETRRGGQTPGKQLIGIRVVDASGRGITTGPALLRNLLRLADFLPGPYVVGLLAIAIHPRNQRLGDMVADTLVVRDRPADRTGIDEENAVDTEGLVVGTSVLDEPSFELLGRVVTRAGQLEADARAQLLAGLALRFAAHLDGRGDIAGQLERLHAHERAARQLGLTRTAARVGSTRLLKAKRDRWDRFAVLAGEAAHGGLDQLPAHMLVDFAERYREVAADLARARTYGASDGLLHRLERLVASGHASLYRDEAPLGGRLRQFVFIDCPRTLVIQWRVIGVAIAVFAAPLAAGFTLIRERPALASQLVDGTMLERADAASARRARGEHYITTDLSERPAIALGIITNNLRVAYTCFAGGIFLGIGALILLFYNGLMLGTSAAHFANVGQLDYLAEFIVGHGPLELFAICVSGAAGFLLGAAILAPGNRTRRDALVQAGREALRLVVAVTLLLLVAGLIEGLISTSGAGWGVRAGASAVGVVLLALYVWNGVRAARLRAPAAWSASAWPAPRSP